MARIKKLPTYDVVRSLFDYDPVSGCLRWKAKTSPKSNRKIGDIAGTITAHGHIHVKIKGVEYFAHRIIWLWMTGNEPKEVVDHKDGCPFNNRWMNLRAASFSQNLGNSKVQINNSAGLKGAHRYKQGEIYGKGWQSKITKNGKHYSLGHFATAEEAHAAYVSAAEKLFGEFARAG